MRKQWIYGGVVAAVLAGGAGVAVFASKGGDAAKKPDGEKPQVALEFVSSEVTSPSMASMPAQIEFSGPLVAPGSVVVRSKSSGTLLTLAVAEGSRVKAGQALGQLDLEEMRYRVAERTASVESARARPIRRRVSTRPTRVWPTRSSSPRPRWMCRAPAWRRRARSTSQRGRNSTPRR